MILILAAATLALAALSIALYAQLRVERAATADAYQEAEDARADARRWRGVARIHERGANEALACAAEWREKWEAAADRTFPAAPWPGEPLREKEIREAEARVLAIVAEKAPWELPLIEARRKRTGKIL